MHKLIIIFILLCSFSTFSAEILLMGGGGEDFNKPGTIFDDSLETFSKTINLKTNNVDVVFNGGHPRTESIVKNNLKIKDQISFIASNAKLKIKQYYEKIKNGEIKANESLVVIIDTHGGPKNDNLHLLATVGEDASNPNVIKASTESLYASDLKILADIAKEKKVNLGIVDLSCHSGNSLALSNSNTCVVSSSGPENYGTNGFSIALYKALGEGLNLEDAFLKARKSETMPSFPMISTDASKKIADDFYKLINPYLAVLYKYQNGSVINKLSDVLDFNAKESNQCKREIAFSSLIKNIEDVLLVSDISSEEFSTRKMLIENLKQYKKLQDSYIEKVKKMGTQYANDKIEIEYEDVHTKKMKKKIMVLDSLIQGDFKANLDVYSKKLKTLDPVKNKEDYLSMKEMVVILSATSNKQAEYLKKYPEYNNKNKFINDLAENEGQKILDTTKKVSTLANIYFDKIYKAQPQTNNPCSKISLKK